MGVRSPPDGVATTHKVIATDTMRYLYELKIYIFDDSSVTSYKTSVLGGYAISSGKIVKKIMKESKLCVLFPTASQSLYGKIMM